MNSNTPFRSINARMVVRLVVLAVLMPMVLFPAAWRLDWCMAWIFVGTHFLFTVGGRLIVALRNPDLLVERGQYLESDETEDWDRVLVPIVALYGPLAIWVVSGLDHRFAWSPDIPPAAQLGALVVVVLGYFFASWALVANKFFSAVVRIQAGRGHTVVTTGPYAIVRHPGYAGALFTYLATPFMLGTLWAVIPAALTIIGLVIRTSLEDQTLQNELDGYQAYSQQTRFRLVPGIW
jgi:protein-S-isoprenylcysteine O-methyltransferase Ste14